MKPYDWCDPRCPNPCSCEETIRENVRAMTQEERDRLGITWKPEAAGSSLVEKEV